MKYLVFFTEFGNNACDLPKCGLVLSVIAWLLEIVKYLEVEYALSFVANVKVAVYFGVAVGLDVCGPIFPRCWNFLFLSSELYKVLVMSMVLVCLPLKSFKERGLRHLGVPRKQLQFQNVFPRPLKTVGNPVLAAHSRNRSGLEKRNSIDGCSCLTKKQEKMEGFS